MLFLWEASSQQVIKHISRETVAKSKRRKTKTGGERKNRKQNNGVERKFVRIYCIGCDNKNEGFLSFPLLII